MFKYLIVVALAGATASTCCSRLYATEVKAEPQKKEGKKGFLPNTGSKHLKRICLDGKLFYVSARPRSDYPYIPVMVPGKDLKGVDCYN